MKENTNMNAIALLTTHEIVDLESGESPPGSIRVYSLNDIFIVFH